jgi:hypothetical protein
MSGTFFPTLEDMQKAGFNKARIDLVQAIEKVYSSENKKNRSMPYILKRLQFEGKTDRNRRIDPPFITSINDLTRNPAQDNISGIKFTELLDAFNSKFSDILITKEREPDITIPQHSHYYIYYYQSYSETEKQFRVKFAVIGFDVEKKDKEENSKTEKSKEWESGVVYYFNEDKKIHKEFNLKRIKPEEANTNTLFFYGERMNQINFYTIKTNERELNLRGILPITYSVLETQHKLPCAGKGILEAIPEGNYKKRVGDLINENKGIDSTIINALFSSKLILNENVFDKPTEFKTRQSKVLSAVTGVWSGVYLRNDFSEKPNPSSENKGGICKFVLHIKSSGECQLYWNHDNDGNHSYSGFVELPFADRSLMKISLEYLEEEETYRKYMFLSATTSPDEKAYTGILSGWMNNGNKIYTSPVYMRRIVASKIKTSNTMIDELLKQEVPIRIPKTNTAEIATIDEEYIEILRGVENEFFSTFVNSMPPHK